MNIYGYKHTEQFGGTRGEEELFLFVTSLSPRGIIRALKEYVKEHEDEYYEDGSDWFLMDFMEDRSANGGDFLIIIPDVERVLPIGFKQDDVRCVQDVPLRCLEHAVDWEDLDFEANDPRGSEQARVRQERFLAEAKELGYEVTKKEEA